MKYHIEFDLEFRKNPHKGLYIAVEGIDGSGKTTQVERLAQYFRSQGKTVVQTREPRKEGLIGDIVQKVLTGQQKVPSVALQYLFSTDRVLHHEDVILPALKKGKIVVSDRCFWSAIVYGILDRTRGSYNYKDADLILIAHSILSMYHRFTVPDHTFYLKVSLVTAILRIGKKDDVKEIYEDKEKLKKLIEGYEWLATKFPQEITIVDGEKSVEEVAREIVEQIK
ncbi:MAG: dTMP kinase [Candidatus Levybacteria bacterium]|nr:dTMP kinase [Candidatus Levybacteria bacterium]